jgi:hypothetical protein
MFSLASPVEVNEMRFYIACALDPQHKHVSPEATMQCHIVKPLINERKPLANWLMHSNLLNHFKFQVQFQAQTKMMMVLKNVLLEL